MLQNLSVFIGRRYIGAKRRNHFISFISTVSMIGLTLGVMVLIIVLSVMNGFERELRERILGMVPHGTISGVEPVENWEALREQALEHPEVRGAAPYISDTSMLISPRQSRGALVTGTDPAYIDEVSILRNHMVSGNLDDLTPGNWNIVLGQSLARQLGVQAGDRINVMVPEVSVNIMGVQPRFKRFTVSGIFQVGAQLDADTAFVHMEDMATLKRMPGAVQGIQLSMNDLFQAPRVTRQLAIDMPGQYQFSDWTRTQGNLFQAIQLEKRMVGLLLFMIVAVAAFNIVSSLIMLVTEKQSDIAILRTMGARPSQIMGIFMVQGGVVGVVGVSIGIILGILGALTIDRIVAFVENLFGFQVLDGSVYFISYLPSELRLDDVILVACVSLVASFLSTLYPAWRASRTLPAEALRYE
ncbi:lipoprotein-releasing ABC transporter permease subunit [Natronospirillum operosum]|uniref:Lipoprotein-releasing ABC transporter permease subunit n=1 Tax=Natronospirillum operosum TaxID=2759953 RepID=A0A4Z0WG43_9GAMM|nr:lipoprotein-releasing ABC transporter permease subunit [Natronospirillum operosum]TGG95578.1 lipoprotein-releasing ABC transporter permease subunit [Natronospirillum operosum]